MNGRVLRVFLMVSTVAIYAITVIVIFRAGFNWPAVFFGDILDMNWRSQFNIDFLIHLLLLATWIAWRENWTKRGYIFGFLSIIMGGMFGFAYILYAVNQAKGDPRKIVLGPHHATERVG